MAGATPFYGMAFFDFRDRLDQAINVRKEIDRFLIIDRQLFGLYSIFGDGVINGWNIVEKPRSSQSSNPIALTVEPGLGIISLVAVETASPRDILELPANDTFDVYAIISGGTVSNRQVRFVISRNALTNGVRLGRVITGSNSILSIDTSFRDEIGFIELIREEVAAHKHRGSPTKINLSSETRNQLPGARVEDFDASKVASGRLDPERIPVLDHNDLENNGLLNHAALDSFARVFTSGNRELLGEVYGTNLMKLLLAWKYQNPAIEDGFHNTVPLIPGVTENSLIDFDASTSYISLPTNCISGTPTSIGRISSVFWETTTAFLTAIDRNLVTIANDQVALTRGGQTSIIIENFEQVASGGVPIPGFAATTITTDDNLSILSEDADSLRTEGFYSGKFGTDRNFRIMYTKTLTSNKDWSLFDELVLDVKSLSLSHGAVFMYFVSEDDEGNETQSQDFLILGQDEITTNPDVQFNSFERRVFAIDSANRSNVTRIVFYTDDTVSKFEFFVDNIFLRNQELYPPEGYIRFRYSSQVPVVFNAINYETQENDDTEIRFRTRVANSPSLLNRASFGPQLNSGDVFSLEGTDIEIDVRLYSNEDRDATPILDLLELQFIVASEEVGFSISDSDEWDRGSYVNAERELDEFTFSSFLKIADEVAIGNTYYTFKNVVTEIDPDRVAVNGFQGATYPLTPNQAFNFVPNQGARGFDLAFSTYRLPDKNFLTTDTANDRVVLSAPDGTFIRSVGSHNASDETFFYPLAASYSPSTGVLTTTFSQEVEVSDLDISKVRLWIGTSFVDLGLNDTPIEETGKTKKILEITLSLDKQEQLRDTVLDISVQYRPGSFPSDFEPTTSAAAVIGVRGIEVFVGDVVYIDGISRPVFANLLDNENWIIGNSSIVFDNAEDSSTSLRIEIQVGQTESFDVEVDPPEDGFIIQWDITVPTELQSVVSTSTPAPGNKTTVNITNPTADLIQEWTLTFVARYINDQDPGLNFSTQTQAILAILPEGNDSSDDAPSEVASIVEVNPETGEIGFTYDLVKFSDYTLGSVYEIDENFFLIAGIVSLGEDVLPGPGQGGQPGETFNEEADRKLAGYRGKVILLGRDTKSISFQYDTPDGSYASDAVVDKDGSFVIAESSFLSNSGRVVRLDSFGNVIWQIGGGEFSKINDVRALLNNNIIVST